MSAHPRVPKRSLRARLAPGAAALFIAAGAACGQTVQLKSTPVATGLQYPLFVTHAPGDSSRLFVVEQYGRVRIVDVLPGGGYSLRPTPFVDITSLITNHYLEYGALGLAFDPNFAVNGFFYLTYTPPQSGSATIASYDLVRMRVSAADRNIADPGSRTLLLRISFTLQQHRAGWIDFGPDGYLYATTGDGGEGDPQNNAANLNFLGGKVLRLDVRGPDGVPGTADDDDFPADPNRNYRIPPGNPFIGIAGAAPEIWAYGFRNPWRASFDRQTGDLWIGDVGQNQWEEVDFQPASSTGGEFYGWRCVEGNNHPYAACGVTQTAVAPIVEYNHTTGPAPLGGTSVTGGYVYRGCAMPSLRGTYFFGDWGGRVWTATKSGPGLTGIALRTPELLQPGQTSLGTMVSFGEDAAGELYYVIWSSTAGGVFKIEPRTPDGPDCNHNSIPDACDIASGASRDDNGNGIPDDCENLGCLGDFNASGDVSVQDLFDYLAAYFGGNLRADINTSGALSIEDLFLYLRAYFRGCA